MCGNVRLASDYSEIKIRLKFAATRSSKIRLVRQRPVISSEGFAMPVFEWNDLICCH
jgi:hypothetical protein